MPVNLQQLSEVVQFNCDVADANFAGNYTMCTYLLKMRELYRWSEGIAQSEKLSTGRISDWVENKEAHWSSLEDKPFKNLSLGGDEFDPFDIEGINEYLNSHQLLYGAGYGRGCRPEFYLAALLNVEQYEGFMLYISGTEYARDLSAPVAMTQGDRIYVRQESIRRMMWEQIEAWRWLKSPEGAFSRAISHFPLETDPSHSLHQLVEYQMEQVINHEIGEVIAGQQLGSEWQDMLSGHPGSKLEIVARAIRDHLADTLSTLPAVVDAGDEVGIHLYFSNMSAMRKVLFPQLITAYDSWCQSKSYGVFKRMIRISHTHWLSQAERLLANFRRQGERLVIEDADISTFQPTFSVH